METRNDLTIVYYTSNFAPEHFTDRTRTALLKVIGGTTLISVSQKPMDFGQNICVGDIGRSMLNVFRQALIGAKAAKTKYIAMAEDDILYGPEHFKYIPKERVFAYNFEIASIFTWSNPPIFSFARRRVLHSMICERDLFIEAIEERFAKWPDDNLTPIRHWGEPGRGYHEKSLGCIQRGHEEFRPEIANIAFCHESGLGFIGLGKKKKVREERAYELPYWGSAADVLKIFHE